MYEFILPNYKDGSIVNLMSSISNSFGKKHLYSELPSLPSKELKKFKNIVFIVIDGLGYNYLKKQKDSFLLKNIRSSLTSTFLSTTACANTTFLTGYPPQQSALTGWDINLKEVGAITTILPFIPVFRGDNLCNSGFEIKNILNIKSFHKGFKGKCFCIINKEIATSPFNKFVSKNAEVITITDYKNGFKKLKNLVKKKSFKRRFIHLYLSDIDHSAHEKGINSKTVQEIFETLDSKIKNLTSSLTGTNTKIIVVADHGFIDTSKKEELWIEDIKGLKECLTIPLSGESRVRDCFVRPDRVKDFEIIVKTKMSKYCWCFKGKQLIKDNLYGLGKPNDKLFDRVGDYVLIMKKHYSLQNRLANYKKSRKFHIGKHAGVTDNEMIVPLITIDC